MQFHLPKVPQVARHDHLCTTGNCQLDQVVIPLVVQVGAPRIVNTHPFTACDKDIQQRLPLVDVQPTTLEELVSLQYVLVLVEQCRTHERCGLPLKTSSHSPVGGPCTNAGSDKDVGIQNHTHPFDGSKFATNFHSALAIGVCPRFLFDLFLGA